MNPIEEMLRRLLETLLAGTGAKIDVSLRVTVEAGKEKKSDV